MGWGFQRCNSDAGWKLHTPEALVLVDPWFEGPVQIGPGGLHRGWHVHPSASRRDVGAVDIAVISQQFQDHCHPASLQQLEGDVTLLAVPDAARGVEAATGRTPLIVPKWGSDPLEVNGLRFWRISRPWWHPPMYHVIVVADAEGRAALHAPHAHRAKALIPLRDALDIHLLAISRQRYWLPFFMGGKVNPGPDVAEACIEATQPRHALVLHDEPKKQVGFITKIAHIDRPEPPTHAPWRNLPGLDVHWLPEPDAASEDDAAK